MDTNPAVVITGAAGFIGSCMVQFLNENSYTNLILVDDFNIKIKKKNWSKKKFNHIIERDSFLEWLKNPINKVDIIIHLGAKTDTAEFDYRIHQALNVDYSKAIWGYCTQNEIPLIYASSAATYGNGDMGYNDDHDIVDKLQPLNPYGISKNEFDKWVVKQKMHPPYWTGLKFFNVYGPNEYHKGRMASVILHSFNQIKNIGMVKLFKSHRPDFEDGQQLRDFVYVKDLLKVMLWMSKAMLTNNWNIDNNGLYNLGTGKARSFYDLAVATFNSIGKEVNVEFIDMPDDIRDKYQYFTEANMSKLAKAGYSDDLYTLEEGVSDYVKRYLVQNEIY